jgi:D-aminoacyl-tRNA deacylase
VRALIQRVSEASVTVAGERVAEVGQGLLVLAAAGPGDGDAEAGRLAAKIARLRVFADDQGKMNRSLLDVAGEALVVSQFTLYGDVSRGNRPSFVGAAPPETAQRTLDALADGLRELGVPVSTGRFGADMQVALVNDGPVTIWLEKG